MTERRDNNTTIENQGVTALVGRWLEEKPVVDIFQRLPASWPTELDPLYPDIRFGEGRFGCLGTNMSLTIALRQSFSFFCGKLCGFNRPDTGSCPDVAADLYFGQLRKPGNLTELACDRVSDQLMICCFESGILTDYRNYLLFQEGRLAQQDILDQYQKRLAACHGHNEVLFGDMLEACNNEISFLAALTPEEFALAMKLANIAAEKGFIAGSLVFALAINPEEEK